MNPIKVIPCKYLDQSFCPECFGKIVKSETNKHIYQCNECGQLFAHPNYLDEDVKDIVYLTFRVYFKYEHLKNFIMHAAYNLNDGNFAHHITCKIDREYIEVQSECPKLKGFFTTDNIEGIYRIKQVSGSVITGRENLHIALSKNDKTRSIHGNFDLIEKVPGIDILYSEMFSICHKLIRASQERNTLRKSIVVI